MDPLPAHMCRARMPTVFALLDHAMKNGENVASTLPGGAFVELEQGASRLAALAPARGLPMPCKKPCGAVALPTRSSW